MTRTNRESITFSPLEKSSPAGNRTRVTRVTGGYTNLYTTEECAERGGPPASKQATGRIELPTLGLQDQCSATELSRPWEKATERIELSTPGLRDLCSATELSGPECPDGSEA